MDAKSFLGKTILDYRKIIKEVVSKDVGVFYKSCLNDFLILQDLVIGSVEGTYIMWEHVRILMEHNVKFKKHEQDSNTIFAIATYINNLKK